MFTGIIETVGTIEALNESGTNVSFWVRSSLSPELQIDQSLSHNGVCLTVEALNVHSYQVTAIAETLAKTNLGQLKPGNEVNLERCMQMNGRLDGHIVQGHVDTTGICLDIVERNGSWEYLLEFDAQFAGLVIEKGSITLNGISLTLFDVTTSTFKVAIIPYTYQHTNIKHLLKGGIVNIEFDMIGKYVNRIQSLK